MCFFTKKCAILVSLEASVLFVVLRSRWCVSFPKKCAILVSLEASVLFVLEVCNFSFPRSGWWV